MPLRRACLDDAPALAELMTELGYPSTIADIERRLPQLLGAPEHLALVAADADDRAVAFLHATRKINLQADPVVEIVALVVGSRFRSDGHGRALVARAEDWAREHGARRIVVRSNVTRERTHRFYLREGYALTKTSHLFEKKLREPG